MIKATLSSDNETRLDLVQLLQV